MKRIFFLSFLLIVNLISNAQWISQVSGTSNLLNSVHFTGPYHGWIVGGDGTIIRTVDGGNEWTAPNSGVTNTLFSVHFINLNLGWVSGTSGVLLKTTDGGTNWISKSLSITNSLFDIQFINNYVGWVVGNEGTILKTEDGGNNWVILPSQTNKDLYSVFFLDNNIGYVVGGGGVSGGLVLKTTNAGISWETKLSGTPWSFTSVHFVDYNTGWVVGDYNRVYKTTNGGASWITQYTGASHGLLSTFFINSNSGWVVGGSNDYAQIIMKTSDEGNTWISQAGTNLKVLMSVYFVDENLGWAVGGDGTVIKYISSTLSVISPNGGENWQVGTTQNITWTSSNITNVKIEYTTNNGTNWTPIVASVPATPSYYAWTIPNTPSTQCRVRISDTSNSTINDVSDNTFTITSQLCKDVNVVNGWNIISVPVQASNMGLSNLFSTATSQAYEYNNGYVNATTLSNGKGYWLKFGSNQSIQICGNKVTQPVSVNAGWNIIGTFDVDVLINQITTTPPNIISSSFFGFNNGYTTAATLQIGKGYWVKASQAGTLNLPSGPAKTSDTNQQPAEINSFWSRIEVEDINGNKGSLYFASGNESTQQYELPPIPPLGIFDVRFTGDKKVESNDKGSYEVQINSAANPIKLRIYNFDGQSLRVKDLFGGKLVDEILHEGGELLITKGLERIMIEKYQLPKKFELSQNYPNPFNPTAMIRFALPEKAKVKLEVYDMLGQKVIDLLNDELDAGNHEVELNAQNLSSGIYFYQITTGVYRAIKKMLVIK